jgi:hypothetical protein
MELTGMGVVRKPLRLMMNQNKKKTTGEKKANPSMILL